MEGGISEAYDIRDFGFWAPQLVATEGFLLRRHLLSCCQAAAARVALAAARAATGPPPGAAGAGAARPVGPDSLPMSGAYK